MKIRYQYALTIVLTAVNSLLQLAVLYATKRESAPESFGKLSFAIGIYGFVFILSDLGLTSACAARLPMAGGEPSAYWRRVVSIRASLAAVVGTAAFLAMALGREAALLFGCFLIVQNLVNAFVADWVLIGQGDVLGYGLVTATQGVTVAAVWSVLHFAGGLRGPVCCLIAMLAGAVCWVSASLARSKMLASGARARRGPEIRIAELIKTWPMSLLMLALIVIQNVDVVALKFVNGYLAASAYLIPQRCYALVIAASYSFIRPAVGVLVKRRVRLGTTVEGAEERSVVALLKCLTGVALGGVIAGVSLPLPSLYRVVVILGLTSPLGVCAMAALHIVYVSRNAFEKMAVPLAMLIGVHVCCAFLLGESLGIVGTAIANAAGQTACAVSIVWNRSGEGRPVRGRAESGRAAPADAAQPADLAAPMRSGAPGARYPLGVG